jgi:lipopolysaccharide export system protein LptA
MQLNKRISIIQLCPWLLLCLIFFCPPLMALESDRQETLLIDADKSDGPLGDGTTTIWGNVDIRQGTLHIMADKAEVIKADGVVKSVTISGKPALLEQEIEEQGLVRATANIIDYQVASGLVTLTGNADVKHPQYQISGDILTYDLNIQHFQGSSDENGNSRIHIKLDPEVINSDMEKIDKKREGEAKDQSPDSKTQTADGKDNN